MVCWIPCALRLLQIFAVILATLHPLECCRFFPHRSIKSRAQRAPRRGNVTSALMTGGLQGLTGGFQGLTLLGSICSCPCSASQQSHTTGHRFPLLGCGCLIRQGVGRIRGRIASKGNAA